MRTTLVIDDDLYDVVRRRAFDERRSVGAVVSELARRGLRDERASAGRRAWGRYAGQIHIADDFDETPPDVLEALDQPLSPA